MVSQGLVFASLDDWEKIAPDGEATEVLSFIKHGVDVWQYFQPFKGKFAGQRYNSAFPPSRMFQNNPSCNQFEDFIRTTIRERVRLGSLLFLGYVGEVEPPHLVMPITVEPTKPRMCR